MTASWMPGHGKPARPVDWIEIDGGLACLACRRDLAAEEALLNATDTTVGGRAELRKHALVDFEIERNPERPNGEIARAIRCSPMAIQKGRDRLGLPKPA